ncbi:MAG: metal ABC transporter substrate-binding protein [Jiangellales bacterium]
MARTLARASVLPTALTAALVLAACGTGDEPTAQGSDEVSVVATTTILGDVVGRVAQCAGASSTAVMPAGVDPHDFTPSSEQVATMVSADLVVANGLGLEEGLVDALVSAESDGATVMEVAPLVDPLPFAGGSHDDETHSDETTDATDEPDDHDDDGDLDPHFWHDAARMAQAAALVGAELASLTGDDAFATCGDEVAAELAQTDAEVRDILAAVPQPQRVMVTDHDAFGYFADAYDFEIAGVVVPGGATLAEPSSQELSDLVAVIQDEGVPAIFSNDAAPTSLTEAVANEAGTEIEVVELYVGSLGPPGSDADTYDALVLTNAQRIATALS